MGLKTGVASPWNQGRIVVPEVVPPWSTVLTLAEAGDNLARLAALYDKRPETGITGSTLELPTTLDGPIHVARFGDLTLNNAIITAASRCRGLFVICDSLTVTGTASVIHMDGKGSTATDWPDYDLSVPSTVSLVSERITQRDLLAAIRESGHYIGDPVFLAGLAPLVQASLVNGANLIVNKTTGLGAGGAGVTGLGAATTYVVKGGDGGAGSRGPGGGGAGYDDVNDTSTRLNCSPGEAGRSWRGGFGGTSDRVTVVPQSGRNVRLGSPGGVLIVAALNALTVGPGLTVRSAGVADGKAVPGGGLALLLTPSAVSGTPTVSAPGASYTADATISGGAGYAVQSTLAAWGL